jgi:hemerythrin-like domain-containing protein
MARSNRAPSRSEPLALELLISDHRKVERLFDRYDAQKDGDEEAKQQLCERICNELKIHAQVEEELFYPWAREQLDEEELIEEALVEHQSAKDLIAQIEAAGQMDESLDAKVKVLGEYIRHHVNEEENEMFPKLRGDQEALDELGQELASRKAELMEEMGIEADEEDEGEAQDEMVASSGGRKPRGEAAQRGSR